MRQNDVLDLMAALRGPNGKREATLRGGNAMGGTTGDNLFLLSYPDNHRERRLKLSVLFISS